MLLILCAGAAVIWANSPAANTYERLRHLDLSLHIGSLVARTTPHACVDDGLMAVFFLLVGLEIRREVMEGQLASVGRAAAPAVAALGGMLVPALIYLAITWRDPSALRGWAIPTATDIAFSLAVLRLLGDRIPGGLRVFLTALAIIDDLGAILIIALFYSADLHPAALAGAFVVLAALAAMARIGANVVGLYLAGFALLWGFVLQSGVHPTLAGVAVAMVVPMAGHDSVGRRLEHALNGWVGYLVLPLFALMNAGLHLQSVSWSMLADPVVSGIAIGLFAGKQAGVFATTWVACRARLIQLPAGLGWGALYGASILCGVGFTMSLFIGNLSFPDGDRATELKLAVFGASVFSAVVAAGVLTAVTRRRPPALPGE